jgi:hypothetical protein
LVIIGVIIRTRADETPEFEASALVDQKSAPARLRDLLRKHPKALLQTAALSAPAVACYTWATSLFKYTGYVVLVAPILAWLLVVLPTS